jgi:hypothetical protein
LQGACFGRRAGPRPLQSPLRLAPQPQGACWGCGKSSRGCESANQPEVRAVCLDCGFVNPGSNCSSIALPRVHTPVLLCSAAPRSVLAQVCPLTCPATEFGAEAAWPTYSWLLSSTHTCVSPLNTLTHRSGTAHRHVLVTNPHSRAALPPARAYDSCAWRYSS